VQCCACTSENTLSTESSVVSEAGPEDIASIHKLFIGPGGLVQPSVVRSHPLKFSISSASVFSTPTLPANTTYGTSIAAASASTGCNTETNPSNSWPDFRR